MLQEDRGAVDEPVVSVSTHSILCVFLKSFTLRFIFENLISWIDLI